MQEMWAGSLGGEYSLDKEMATHSRVLAWEMPWTEGPGGLQCTGCRRVGSDLEIKEQQHSSKKKYLLKKKI